MADHADRRLVPLSTRSADFLEATRSPVISQCGVPSRDGRSGRDCLEMTGLAAIAWQRILAAAHVDWNMADLACAAGPPAPQPAVEQQSSSDPGSDGDNEGGPGASSRPHAGLG
jgi:hypothetical protein